MHDRILYRLTWLALVMSLGHHLDHLIRHNAVGWPLTGEVNAFTASLVVYPIIVTGLLLYRAGRVGPGFWALVSGGAVFVSTVHFGPAALEPPELILGHYQPPVLGWLAFGWLVTFVAVLAVTCVRDPAVGRAAPRPARRPAGGGRWERAMSATPPSAASGRQPSGPSQAGCAATGVGGAAVLVGTRMALWLGVQLGLAGLLLVTGRAATGGEALNDAAGWWMVYAALVDLSTLAVIGGCCGAPAAPTAACWGRRWPSGRSPCGRWGCWLASVPAVVFSGELTSAVYGQATAPMFAVVDVSPVAGILSVLVAPLLAELAEPVAYLGVVLPRLEERLGRSWLAAVIVVAVWAGEHALYPLLASGGVDLGFAAYRVASVLPYLATWTALYYALGLLPIMAARWVFNGGTALALALGLVE